MKLAVRVSTTLYIYEAYTFQNSFSLHYLTLTPSTHSTQGLPSSLRACNLFCSVVLAVVRPVIVFSLESEKPYFSLSLQASSVFFYLLKPV